MLLLIDYGIGNIRSLEKAFQAVGIEPVRSDDPADIARADKLVLPGVGAFGACADEIRQRGLWEPVLAAIDAGTPFLGVCVGMQLLFDVGEERGAHEGLGVLPGRVVHFHAVEGSAVEALKVPHMGWNTVRATHPSPLLDGIADGAHFYFVHSYHAAPERESDVLGVTEYGEAFPAIVQRGTVAGVQFHPEKSQDAGLRLLRNFADRGAE
jgi:glutamine amidotransferase